MWSPNFDYFAITAYNSPLSPIYNHPFITCSNILGNFAAHIFTTNSLIMSIHIQLRLHPLLILIFIPNISKLSVLCVKIYLYSIIWAKQFHRKRRRRFDFRRHSWNDSKFIYLYKNLGMGLVSGIIVGIISLFGFTTGGVAAGSIAAGVQSLMGGTVAAWSIFATLQSIGATGAILLLWSCLKLFIYAHIIIW